MSVVCVLLHPSGNQCVLCVYCSTLVAWAVTAWEIMTNPPCSTKSQPLMHWGTWIRSYSLKMSKCASDLRGSHES